MKFLVLVVAMVFVAQLSACGDVECDSDADCGAGQVCADAGGVLFASRVCVAADARSDMSVADMADGGSDACIARSSQDICLAIGAECGTPSVMECGAAIEPSCGRCESNEECSETYECTCVPEADEEFCSRFGADCGEVTNLDNCGSERTVACGTCTGTDTCGEFQANVCGCPCEIENICYPADAVNPANSCERCLPETADDQWSVTEGASCSDDKLCTENDSCDASGQCIGDPVVCMASNECRPSMCDPSNGACVEDIIQDGQACGEDDGLTCTRQVCMDGMCAQSIDFGWCLIDGVCYQGGDANPAEPCQLCRHLTSNTTWSAEGAGKRCDNDNLNCTDQRCDGMGACVVEIDNNECLIDGVCVEENDQNLLNECEECLPEDSQTTWSPVKLGVNCGSVGCECNGRRACVDQAGGVCI